MSLIILKAEWWKLIFQKKKRNNSKVELPSFLGGGEIEKRKRLKEKSSQLEEISGKEYRMFLTRQIEKERWTRKRHIENGLNKATDQLLEIYNYHREETLDFLKNLFEKQPQFVEDIIKLKKGLESNAEGLQEKGKIGDDSKEHISREEIKENNKETSKKEFDTNEKKEKMGIFDIIHPLTKEEYKRLPLTFRDLFEKFWVDKIYKLPRKIRSEEIKVYFLETLKRFRRYAPSYKEKNKQDINDIFVRMLERADLQEEKEIIDIIKECRELIKTEKKS